MGFDGRDEGLSGLEMIIMAIILCVVLYTVGSIAYSAMSPETHDTSGLIAGAQNQDKLVLVVSGTAYGIQNDGGEIMGVDLAQKNVSGSEMGSCTIPLKVLVGQMTSVDLDNADMVFTYNGNSEKLPYSNNSPLTAPSWTIAQKSSMIPLGSADEDNILEPNEIFTILVYPDANVPSSGKFSVVITPKAVHPLTVNTAVPPEITIQRIVELYV